MTNERSRKCETAQSRRSGKRQGARGPEICEPGRGPEQRDVAEQPEQGQVNSPALPTQEQIEKAKAANISNIFKKLKAGATLTNAEREVIDQLDNVGKKRVLPIFESINQCSAATGVPVAVLRAAKKAGCMAFKHSRLDFAEFIKWFFSQSNDIDSENWPVRCKRAEALIKENQLDKVQGKTLDRDDVARAIGKAMSLLSSNLDRKIKVELPPNLKGRSEAEIMERLEVALAEACDVARMELEAVTKLEKV